MTLQGLHAPNKSWTEADYDVIRAMQAQSVKLLTITGCQHTVDDVTRLKAIGVQHFTVRLWDSRDASGRILGDVEYANKCIATIQQFYKAGVRLFQTDNEPNFQYLTQEAGPWQYQWLMKRVVPLIRAAVPADVKLISPPLSFSPAFWAHGGANPGVWLLDEWFAAFMFTNSGKEPSLWSLFDFVGANCYWQNDRQMGDPSFGECWEVVSQKAGGKRVVVLEWASSAHQLTNPDGSSRYWPAQVEALRIAQYPPYLARLEDSGLVEASYAYLIGGTADWQGFKIDTALGRAMRPVSKPTNS